MDPHEDAPTRSMYKTYPTIVIYIQLNKFSSTFSKSPIMTTYTACKAEADTRIHEAHKTVTQIPAALSQFDFSSICETSRSSSPSS